jgi:hypothetical protein
LGRRTKKYYLNIPTKTSFRINNTIRKRFLKSHVDTYSNMGVASFIPLKLSKGNIRHSAGMGLV